MRNWWHCRKQLPLRHKEGAGGHLKYDCILVPHGIEEMLKVESTSRGIE